MTTRPSASCAPPSGFSTSLGWPDDGPAPAELTAEEAMVVSQAARIQLTHGLDPDPHARGRIARGPADQLSERSGTLVRLLERLERAPS